MPDTKTHCQPAVVKELLYSPKCERGPGTLRRCKSLTDIYNRKRHQRLYVVRSPWLGYNGVGNFLEMDCVELDLGTTEFAEVSIQ